jgi:malate dehydrogenase (oxaloacetate-decarboxylating)
MPENYPGIAYSITVRAEYPNKSGMLGRITSAIGEMEGDIGSIDIVFSSRETIGRDFTVNARDVKHGQEILGQLQSLPDVHVINVSDPTFLYHLGGKIEMRSKVPVKTRNDLSMAYTPGVGRVSMAIYADPSAQWNLTAKNNTVAVVSDGTAVLGLGDIGPAAAMPVMEGKALLFKELAGVDSWPICLATKDPDEIIATVRNMSVGFGGINLEDISAPRCFYIEDRLKEELDIPVFHDDQHGTAVVVLAAITNALKIVEKRLEDIKIVLVGAGASGIACGKILIASGASNIIGFDRTGALSRGRDYTGNSVKQWFADNTNPDNYDGDLMGAMQDADMFLGLSGPGIVTVDHLKRMASNPIVFAMANPDPEITPEVSMPYVRIMATGRSDYPNQVNNALCFPGIFRGALDARATAINEEMKLAAAWAIASSVSSSELNEEYIIPSVFDRKVVSKVAKEVAAAAHRTGVARRSRKRLGAYYLP